MECDPPVNAEVVKVAIPLARIPLPIDVLPSLNVTLPVGVPAPEATVAVNVTVCPKIDGLGSDVRAVVVLEALTICVSELDTLELKLLLPSYWAVMECVPPASDEIVSVA